MPRIAKRSKAKSSKAKPASRKTAPRAAATKKVKRGIAAAARRAPAKRAAAKKTARKAAARRPATSPARVAKTVTQKKTRGPIKATAGKHLPGKVAAAPPGDKKPLSAEAQKKLAGEHLRTLLEEKKRRSTQAPAWQAIAHHDHAPRLPDAMPHGALSGSTLDHVPGDQDDDN